MLERNKLPLQKKERNQLETKVPRVSRKEQPL